MRFAAGWDKKLFENNNLCIFAYAQLPRVMVKDKTIWKDTALQVSDNFELDHLPEGAHSYRILKQALTHAIKGLLDENREKLFHILYRIDVDEEAVHQSLKYPAGAAEQIADLVIVREKQKLQTRRQYGSDRHQSFKDL